VHQSPLPPDLPLVLFFAWGTSRHHGPDIAGDGVIALKSQLDPRIQFQARRVFGFGQSHVGILDDAVARARFLESLDEMAAR